MPGRLRLSCTGRGEERGRRGEEKGGGDGGPDLDPPDRPGSQQRLSRTDLPVHTSLPHRCHRGSRSPLPRDPPSPGPPPGPHLPLKSKGSVGSSPATESMAAATATDDLSFPFTLGPFLSPARFLFSLQPHIPHCAAPPARHRRFKLPPPPF